MNGSESAINRCGRRGVPCARTGHLPASIETATAEMKSRLLMMNQSVIGPANKFRHAFRPSWKRTES